MKLVKTEFVLGEPDETLRARFKPFDEQIKKAISKVTNPPTASDFAINPVRKGNGVAAIKKQFIDCLANECQWLIERELDGRASRRGVDALRLGEFAVEWETGNISSSHRAMNKMCLGILDGKIFGGALVLPSAGMYRYLTDRVGSFPEIQPYFRLWARVLFPYPALLVAYAVEHDRTDSSIPVLAKGKDGNAEKEELLDSNLTLPSVT